MCLQALRSHLVFEMHAVMKELLGQLIAQFLVNVITVHTDVAQDNCHATSVSRRNADVTARRSRSVGKAAVCSGAFASELDLCLNIGSHHGVNEQFVHCGANADDDQQKLEAHSFVPLTCVPDVTICWDSVTDSVKMQINPVCEQDFKLNVEHDINIHDVSQFASEVCNVVPNANWTLDVLDKPVLNVVPISSRTVWDVWRLTCSVAV